MRDEAGMPERLEAFLSSSEPGRSATCRSYEAMTGGYSRAMARADIEWDDGSTETLVLRGDPPADQALLHTDRDTEWALLDSLTTIGTVPMPAARYYDGTGEHLGTKCIVLDFCTGPSLQSLIEAAGEGNFGDHPDRFVEAMAKVHATPIDGLPAAVDRPTDWSTYMNRRNAEWAEADGLLADANPVMRYVGAWLDAHRPPPLPLVLVHGDFQPANILVDNDGYEVIDWEYTHIGDPREDLGWYVNYGMASPPSLYSPDPEGFLAKYRELTGYSELHINQATVGYFATVSAVRVFSGLLLAASAMAQGENTGVMTTYNINAATNGHTNFLGVCAMLGDTLDELTAQAEALA